MAIRIRYRRPDDAPAGRRETRTPDPRDLPLRSPTGGTRWPDDMRRSRPTNKGRGVPGQHRG